MKSLIMLHIADINLPINIFMNTTLNILNIVDKLKVQNMYLSSLSIIIHADFTKSTA